LKNVEKHHGINALSKKHQDIIVNKSNKNDIVLILGSPSTKSTFDENTWYYIERKIARLPLKKLGKKKIIGITCHNSKKLALDAKKIGANYIAFGAFFKSSTKKTKYNANLALLRWSKKKINIPIVAIGGINNSNYKKVLSNGAKLIACSGYIWNNEKLDPVSAIKKFR
jgi:thiamine-phosphate pyrophosphorylase